MYLTTVLKRILILFVNFCLLFSSFHFSIGTHYCMGEEVHSKVLLPGVDLGCSAGSVVCRKDNVSTPSTEDSISKTPCCQNEYLSMDWSEYESNDSGVQFESIASISFWPVQAADVISLQFTYFKQPVPIQIPPPTSLKSDAQSLYGVYLI